MNLRETNQPALRLPDGLLVVPNPNDDAPVALLPKAELLPNPSRIIVKTYNKKKLQTKQLKTQVLGKYSKTKHNSKHYLVNKYS